MRVQAFRSEFAVERLDEGVVSGLARSGEVERDRRADKPRGRSAATLAGMMRHVTPSRSTLRLDLWVCWPLPMSPKMEFSEMERPETSRASGIHLKPRPGAFLF